MSGPGNSWPAFLGASVVTGAIVSPLFGPIRHMTAWEIARFLGFVVAASLALIIAVRWLRALFGASRPRVGGTTGILATLAVLIPMALPVLLIHRPPNTSEPATLGDIRVLLSAEAAYRAASGGAYGPPECLAAPTTCIPGYSVTQPTFLDSQMASLLPKSGYKRAFHPGPAALPPADGKPAPKGGLARYAYTAVPVRPGLTGSRGFCADSTGRLCFTTDGSAPPVADGRCAETCQDLR